MSLKSTNFHHENMQSHLLIDSSKIISHYFIGQSVSQPASQPASQPGSQSVSQSVSNLLYTLMLCKLYKDHLQEYKYQSLEYMYIYIYMYILYIYRERDRDRQIDIYRYITLKPFETTKVTNIKI